MFLTFGLFLRVELVDSGLVHNIVAGTISTAQASDKKLKCMCISYQALSFIGMAAYVQNRSTTEGQFPSEKQLTRGFWGL